MANELLKQRLLAIQKQLMAVHAGGAQMAASTKGSEREHFIDLFLGAVLPSTYRFGRGDVTNANGAQSGQLDVVVELPHLPSVPMVGGKERLYMAESVGAVIEVKSDIAGQWNEALGTASALAKVNRDVRDYEFSSAVGPIKRVNGRFQLGSMSIPDWRPPSHRGAQGWVEITDDRIKVVGVEERPERIPLFAVGYKGWTTMAGLQKHIEDGEIDGVLVLDSLLFASPHRCGAIEAQGPEALWAFICAIHDATRQLIKVHVDPRSYCYPDGWEPGKPLYKTAQPTFSQPFYGQPQIPVPTTAAPVLGPKKPPEGSPMGS